MFLVFRITKIVSILSQLCILNNISAARNKIYKFKIVNDNGVILYKSKGKILEKLKHRVHDESDRYIWQFILELRNINEYQYTVYTFVIETRTCNITE